MGRLARPILHDVYPLRSTRPFSNQCTGCPHVILLNFSGEFLGKY